MCFSSATGTTVTVSCRYLQFLVAQLRLCDGPTGGDSPSFLRLSNRCWPEKHFQAVTWRADDAVTSRQHGGFDDRKREKVSPLVTRNVFFLLFFFGSLISGGIRVSQIPSAFPSCPPLRSPLSLGPFRYRGSHLDSRQRSSESHPQRGRETEQTIKRTFMGHREEGKNNDEWPASPRPVVETASGEIERTKEGRRNRTITV